MKLKTLIIDDHPASIAILKNMLDEVCECFVTTRGQKGIELFEYAYKNGVPFEVVLLDIIMPGLDGIETLKKIRTIEASYRVSSDPPGKLARIIMQTSSEDPQDYESSHMEGNCSGFINKPYSRGAILDMVLGRGKEVTADRPHAG